MVRLKQFSCRRCGTTFMLRARKAYYCPECRKKHASEYVMQKRAEKDPAVKVGVGSGGNQRGKKNHQFKDGRSHYREVFDRENPYQTPPPYEKLMGDLQGAYSRRINLKHRLVYEVLEKEQTVKIISLWTHYEF